jgi:hypothetical protein
MLKLRFKLQKNQSSKLQKNVKKSKIAHLCLKNMLLFKNQQKPKKHTQNKKKQKIFLFLINFNFKISYNQISST